MGTLGPVLLQDEAISFRLKVEIVIKASLVFLDKPIKAEVIGFLLLKIHHPSLLMKVGDRVGLVTVIKESLIRPIVDDVRAVVLEFEGVHFLK